MNRIHLAKNVLERIGLRVRTNHNSGFAREVFTALSLLLVAAKATCVVGRLLSDRKEALKLEQETARSREATDRGANERAHTEELLRTLRGEIFAAQMKVILDQQLGRETSPIVKKLAALKLPPTPRTNDWNNK